MEFTKFEKISLKSDPFLNEKWVQDRIAEDPGILGLGDVILKDKERIQPRAGRLDLLLQDRESPDRYEVEIQLGATDESHIIRTIEYWDIERKKYPQYEHTAVIVAEDITGRFLNVISLFNGAIPLVAVKMKAIKLGDKIGLDFTTVLDKTVFGLVDEDEEIAEVTDRAYWESQGNKATVSMADEFLGLAQSIDNSLELKYNKFYIDMAKDGIANNFIILRPKKGVIRFEPRLENSPELTQKLENAGLDVMEYDKRWNRYRIRLKVGEIAAHKQILSDIVKEAYRAAENK